MPIPQLKLNRVLLVIFLFFFLPACGSKATPDTEATIVAALAATEAAQPTNTATPEPTNTPTPEPTDTATPEPADTATPESVNTPPPEVSDTSILEPTNVPDLEPLTLATYADEGGFFEIDLPDSWKVEVAKGSVFGANEDETAVVIALALPDNGLSEADLEAYSKEILGKLLSESEFEVEKVQTEKNFMGVLFTGEDETGSYSGTLVLLLGSPILYHLVFVAESAVQDQYGDVFSDILSSFTPTYVAAPTPEPEALPTQTTAPAANPLTPITGRSRLYVFNEYGEELTFTIDGVEHKIPPGSLEDLTPIDLDPGQYTYTVSVPSGAVNGEVDLPSDQSWAVGVRGDGAVYDPFQVYP